MPASRENRALRAAAGVACIALGSLLLGRPFASLAVLVVGIVTALLVLGVRELVAGRGSRA
jgi:uncharacterized membrane protein HdeD (DUF308 family)